MLLDRLTGRWQRQTTLSLQTCSTVSTQRVKVEFRIQSNSRLGGSDTDSCGEIHSNLFVSGRLDDKEGISPGHLNPLNKGSMCYIPALQTNWLKEHRPSNNIPNLLKHFMVHTLQSAIYWHVGVQDSLFDFTSNHVGGPAWTLFQKYSWHHLRNIPTDCVNHCINTNQPYATWRWTWGNGPVQVSLSFFIPVNYFPTISSIPAHTNTQTLTSRHRRCCVTVLTQVGGLKSAPHTEASPVAGQWLKDLCAVITPLYSHPDVWLA